MRQQLGVWMCGFGFLLAWIALASAAGQAIMVQRSSASASLSRRTVACGTSDPTDSSYYYCPLQNSGSVRLLRRLTDFPCTYNESWGFDRGGVWVQNGCRAEFAAGGGYYGGTPGASAPGDGNTRKITCSSEKHQYTYCSIKVRNGVRLSRRLSSAPCKYRNSWGYDADGVWVNYGCRAEFSVR